MGYWKKSWKSRDGSVQIVDKYHSRKMQPRNPLVREKRRKRTGVSTPTQEQVNLRHRVDRLARLLLDNFTVGDWWVTFKLAEPVDAKTFRREYERMIRRMRDGYRKCGHELKYIAVLENLAGRGRMHGHIIVNNVSVFSQLKKLMQTAWQLGDCHIKPYGGDAMDAQRLASYMCKEDVMGKAIREKKKLMTAAREGRNRRISSGRSRRRRLSAGLRRIARRSARRGDTTSSRSSATTGGPSTDIHTSTQYTSGMGRYSQGYTQDVDKNGAQYKEAGRGNVLPAQRPAASVVSVGSGTPPAAADE